MDKFQAMRASLKLDYANSNGLEVRLASTQREWEAAFRVLHDSYVDEGYMAPDPRGLRATRYHALPSTSVAVALEKGEVIGTVSFIKNGLFGLPSGALFDLREDQRRVIEISSLAIKKEFRSQHGRVLFPLIRFVLKYATQYLKGTHLYISVNPKHVSFYRAFLAFEPLGKKEERYEFVNGAPAEGLTLNLAEFPYRYRELYQGSEPSCDLAHYVLNTDFPWMKFPIRQFASVSDRILTSESFGYFFGSPSPVLNGLSPEQSFRLLSSWGGNTFQKHLPEFPLPASFRGWGEVRYDVEAPALYLDTSRMLNDAVILNVSQKGMGVQFRKSVPHEARISFHVAPSDGERCHVLAQRRWQNGNQLAGYELMNLPPVWAEWISYLNPEKNRGPSCG